MLPRRGWCLLDIFSSSWFNVAGACRAGPAPAQRAKEQPCRRPHPTSVDRVSGSQGLPVATGCSPFERLRDLPSLYEYIGLHGLAIVSMSRYSWPFDLHFQVSLLTSSLTYLRPPPRQSGRHGSNGRASEPDDRCCRSKSTSVGCIAKVSLTTYSCRSTNRTR